MQYVHALATRPVTTPVHGISKNNTFSGHTSIRPNYAAYLKYAFSAENSAGIIRQTLQTARPPCSLQTARGFQIAWNIIHVHSTPRAADTALHASVVIAYLDLRTLPL